MGEEEASQRFIENPTECPHCGSSDFVPAERRYDDEGHLHIYYACGCNGMWWGEYQPVVLGEY